MHGIVNPSGTTERYGLIQIRLDFCLDEGDSRYNDSRFYVIDETSKAFTRGYKGKLDEFGSPVDPEAYQAWAVSLPRVWLTERAFHHHFIYLDPYTIRDEQITEAINHHLPNFYKAWIDEWDKVQGGMRHGFDVATRIRPPRYEDAQRTADCLLAVESIKSISAFVPRGTAEGQTFPSTDIDVGSAAIYRTAPFVGGYTIIDYNNAANDTGHIDTVETYMNNGGAGTAIAGTFYASSDFKCRDSQSIGTTVAGAHSTTGLDISVSAGDFIGIYMFSASDYICRAGSGGSGIYYKAGEYIDPGDEATFTLGSGDILSLYGTGETGGWANIAKVGSVAVGGLAKINGVAVAGIAKINGVAV